MIPGPWAAVVLLLGTYRLVRLIGWDDFPPIYKLRASLTGERVYTSSVDSTEEIHRYSRPLLAHFLGCAFCQGFWLSLAVYVAWLISSAVTLYALAAFALSGAVGLLAKNLDP